MTVEGTPQDARELRRAFAEEAKITMAGEMPKVAQQATSLDIRVYPPKNARYGLPQPHLLIWNDDILLEVVVSRATIKKLKQRLEVELRLSGANTKLFPGCGHGEGWK